MLARHPANPHRPYLPWQRKLQIKLDELRQVPNPDIRTKGEIAHIEQCLHYGISPWKERGGKRG